MLVKRSWIYQKVHIYKFPYDRIKKKYEDRATLLYTDCDSLIYEIQTEDIYKDMKEDEDLYDFSDYPKDHPCYSEKNKKGIR
jgi:hypothetical protein